jgi:hypothetical protein
MEAGGGDAGIPGQALAERKQYGMQAEPRDVPDDSWTIAIVFLRQAALNSGRYGEEDFRSPKISPTKQRINKAARPRSRAAGVDLAKDHHLSEHAPIKLNPERPARNVASSLVPPSPAPRPEETMARTASPPFPMGTPSQSRCVKDTVHKPSETRRAGHISDVRAKIDLSENRAAASSPLWFN